MARIRTIKPEFPQSESMGRVSRDARLLYVMLWTICDDAGRARANSRMLASLCFPYDQDADAQIDAWLDELEREKCIFRYAHGADRYVAVCNWTRHQKIDHPAKSRLPEPPALVKPRERSRRPREDSPKPREDQRLDLGPRKGSKDQDLPESTLDDAFETFWSACPKKIGKQKARPLFDAAAKNVSRETLTAAMVRYAASRAGQDEKFTLHPANWLAQERWQDDLPDAPVKSAPHESWNGHAEKLIAEVGEGAFTGYFAQNPFAIGPPARLILATAFLRDLIERKFSGALARAFGSVTLEVKA